VAAAPSAPTDYQTLAPASSTDMQVRVPRPTGPGMLRITPMQNDHDMVTRGKQGFHQPKERLNLHAATLSPLPRTYRGALADHNWRDAMSEEFAALQANDMWSLVPWPAGANVVTSKWVYRHKFLPDDTLDRYKACWVLRDFT
jgi:hypothetical protein